MRETLAWLGLIAAALLSALGATLPDSASDPAHPPSPPLRPMRVVALSVPAAEIALELIDLSRVVALSEFVDDPDASNVVQRAAQVHARVIPAVESIIPLRPDLVLLSTWADPLLVARLHEAGIATHAMQTPASVDEVRAELRSLGQALGEADGALRLVRELDARLEAVRSRLRGCEEPSLILYSAGGSTAASGTLFPALARVAGARPLAAERGLVGFVTLGLEDLLSLDPDVIIDHPYRADGRARAFLAPRGLADDERLRGLQAIRSGHVLSSIPSAHLLATTHHVASLVEDLARALHPERFSDALPR